MCNNVYIILLPIIDNRPEAKYAIDTCHKYISNKNLVSKFIKVLNKKPRILFIFLDIYRK